MSTVVNSNFNQIKRSAIALLLLQSFVMGSDAFAQSIMPTQGVGDLGTQVTPDINNAQQLNITGGTQAAANLYHSFQQFGLTQGEIANFMSNSSIQNILARVTGGDASVINGLVQVTGGNSNLYLLNPAGIIFGANSSLNVPAAFTATTASGIQVGNSWFGVNTGIDDVKKLTGTPQAFGFASSTTMPTNEQPAAIVNAGNLTAKEGQSITLVGGLVINTGTITSPSGKVTIAASADGKYVKITPEGSLLSLQLPIADQNQLALSNVQAKDLPNLLTGSANLRNITGLNVDTSSNVLVAGTAIPNTAGTVIASGNIDVSSNTNTGNGGFVEVSGKDLLFQGKVNTTALNGLAGTLLIDLTNLNITDTTLLNVEGNIILQATKDIRITSPAEGFKLVNNLTSLKFIAGENIIVNSNTDGGDNSFFFNSIASPTLSLTAQKGNINITGNFVVNNLGDPGTTVNLNAPNAAVLVENGYLQIGQAGSTSDNVINITAAKFRITGTPIFNDGPGYSIYTFVANTTSKVNISLKFGDEDPIIISNINDIDGNNLINIHLLIDTEFVVGKTLTNNSSVVDGQIGIGIDKNPSQVLKFLSEQSFYPSNDNRISPQVFDVSFYPEEIENTFAANTLAANTLNSDAILSDQSFSSNTGLANTLAANTLNSDAIATARTADLQANADDVQECEPTGTKKPLLTITASLPSVPTRTAQNPNRSTLPPCKE
ncbi:MAG: filamentous hemagglutinin N-terminal domain-containing protein [Pseudanabaena sp. M135S2SP2A07QC]|nr:filamentous hemagglutinin N-terminal domain-containing protein [Pseudanabaena sp. M090S1SP2A07QC]MCA6506755.1 filamentous hemagglutinin N-terminal domain-containing protein [Pseudanabaena sp. M172S2SP2A07QC]MCA6521364.1 filamentous hemagglutinin N-terminal domain-containing protein [Pseudanabaena sp. M051S1SP2A07QC]MCA6525402.1 filamentous hemagglutinin N-terminal domain-containing protein [Pseudanabaena sp. M179S2SP2A07QC]MCA6532005.1 filamentous hemagglutinin N-terminal domain-containing p